MSSQPQWVNLPNSTWSEGMEAESQQKQEKGFFDLYVNSISTLRIDSAVIGVQLCSSVTATFLQKHFLVKFNSPSFLQGWDMCELWMNHFSKKSVSFSQVQFLYLWK